MRSLLYLGVIFALFSLAVRFSSKSVETTVQHNADWSPIVGTFHRMEMVFVPAGCFRMGDTSNAVEQCIEQPFWIGRFEVNVTQFNAFFRKAGVGYNGYRRDSMLPVDRATWFGAHDFCAELGMRLPTAPEWEYAARGPDSLLYPWGNEYAHDLVVAYRDHVPGGSSPGGVSWVGAHDMSGSVAEWTSSIRGLPDDGSGHEDDISTRRIVMSSSFVNPKLTLTYHANASLPTGSWFGFRCVFSPHDDQAWRRRLFMPYIPPTP